MSRVGLAVLVGAFTLAASACSGTHASGSASGTQQSSRTPSFTYGPAAPALQKQCRAVARSLGYPVPCLNRTPTQMTAFGRIAFISRGPGTWRRWAVGSTNVGEEHLVVTASPHPLQNYAKVVNGPAWYPQARVRPLAWVNLNGWHIRAVYVPPGTNDGSAFAHHVVLIWTAGQHTYGIGFHDVHGLRETLRLDEQLMRHVRLVGP